MDVDGNESAPATSDAQTDSSCEPVLKRCSRCHLEYSLDEFWNSKNSKKDGLSYWCKSCWKASRKRQREGTDACNETCDVELDPCDAPDSLYVIENPRIPGEIKLVGPNHLKTGLNNYLLDTTFGLLSSIITGERDS